MIPIITYLLCVYLVFKGVEVFQIAYMSTSESRKGGMVLGVLAISASLFFAVLFALWITSLSVDLPRIP